MQTVGATGVPNSPSLEPAAGAAHDRLIAEAVMRQADDAPRAVIRHTIIRPEER
jgi:hypothetical protein